MATASARKQGGKKVAVVTQVPASPEWKRVAGQAADEEGLPLSEFIVRVVADYLGRPDLAVVPRKKPGRPRKDQAAQVASNGKHS